MINTEVLDKAVKELSDEGKQEIVKMINTFEDYRAEVAKLEETANAFELVCKIQVRKIENLENKIKELTTTREL